MSMSSLPAAATAGDGLSRTPCDHNRSLSAGGSSSGDDQAGPHRTSGYLQPLVGNASAGQPGGTRYLQLLNMSAASAAASSTPQLHAIRRHDRQGRPDYSPLVRDGNDSSGTSLIGADTTRRDSRTPAATAYPPMRPGPSPLYGRHAARERRVQSMNCDRTG